MKYKLEEYHRNVANRELISDLKRVASLLGKTSVTISEYNKYGKFSASTLIRRHGSWFTASEKAGLEKSRNLGLTEKELIDDLVRVARHLKKNRLTRFEYRNAGKFSPTPFCRLFGSWFKALERAGLEKTRNLGITNEEYFVNLEEVWTKLGRQPHYKDMQKPLSKYSAGAYEYRFGTWRKALERFIEYVNKEKIPAIDEETSAINQTGKAQKNQIRHKTKRNISWRLRFIVMKRDNFRCVKCGRSPATDPEIILHVDHVMPYSKGGESLLENLQTLCSRCNIGKSNL
jgi:hypothetical protein